MISEINYAAKRGIIQNNIFSTCRNQTSDNSTKLEAISLVKHLSSKRLTEGKEERKQYLYGTV